MFLIKCSILRRKLSSTCLKQLLYLEVVQSKGGRSMKKAKKLAALLIAAVMTYQTPYMVFAASNTAVATAKETKKVTGKVKEIQKYGNLTLEIAPKALYDAGYELGDLLTITIGDKKYEMPFGTSYSDVDTSSLIARDDKENNLLVIAINMGNFANTYNVKVGDQVSFELKQKAGYLDEYILRQLKRTNNRSDYKTDSIFANFRSVTTTGIKPGVLYRSSSPINNEIGRASYADELAKAVGVKTVLNLADEASNIKTYAEAEDFNSPYYKSLFDEGKVTTLSMDVDVSNEAFGKKLVEGLRFLSKNKGPYLVHCTEGKDRAGFVSAILEALMGASLDEIVDDYMVTYENYYGVEKGSEQYQRIAESNIVTSMTTIICGKEKGTDISKEDLSKAVSNYLIKMGMTEAEVKAVKSALSVNSIYGSKAVSGTVKEIEKYGHAATDIKIEDFNKLGYEYGDMVTAIFDNGFVVEAPYLDGYYVDNGKPLVRAYPGQEHIAVCINYGKLNEIANISAGTKVTLMLTGAKGYLDQYEVRKLERSNDRKDYSADDVFANFRAVSGGTIAPNVLYRSSSPVNNEIGRAAYANQLAEKAGIKTIINLADSKENIEKYMADENYNSDYYAKLYKSNNVLPLNMGLAYQSDEFKNSIISGLKYMTEKKGPYLFHCTEGKDRTGFLGALLEAYMGATKEEIVEDYAKSYINFYGIEKGDKKYEVISQDVIGMLEYIAGTKDLSQANLQKGAKAYMISGGMTEEELSRLTKNLSTPAK